MKLIQKLLGQKQSLPALPLSLEDSRESRDIFLTAGALTDKGRTLDHNEDALFTLNALISLDGGLLPLGLHIVADGMGGHEDGDRASSLAVRLVADWILTKIYHPLLLDGERSANLQPINQVLREAAIAANGRIHEVCSNGGTTLTCALVLGTNAFLVHVGDSRAYILSKNTIRQITTDHSLVNRLIELGQITPQEAKTHPQRNVLYRALGLAGSLEVDTYLQSLPVHSSLLLCSDGLWQMVPQEAILFTVNSATSPQTACRQLIALANENGGEDNITAVLVQVRNG
jgi:serine/threonine protein phosphatase PrpC